jgi:hypothetical protein
MEPEVRVFPKMSWFRRFVVAKFVQFGEIIHTWSQSRYTAASVVREMSILLNRIIP